MQDRALGEDAAAGEGAGAGAVRAAAGAPPVEEHIHAPPPDGWPPAWATDATWALGALLLGLAAAPMVTGESLAYFVRAARAACHSVAAALLCSLMRNCGMGREG